MSRLSHLNVSLLTVGSYNFLGNFEALGFDPEVLTQDGRGIGQRYGLAIDTKKRLSWELTELLTDTSSSLRVSNLDVKVFNIDGLEYLGDIRSGGISVNTAVFEGSGDGDLWESPVANDTTYEINGNMLMNGGAHPILSSLMSNTRQSAPVIGIVTVGPLSVTLPLTLGRGKHEVSNSQGQSIAITAHNRGNVSLAATDTASGVMSNALLGSAVVAWAAQTGGGNYSGNALIISSHTEWADQQIVKGTHQFHNIGQPTYG